VFVVIQVIPAHAPSAAVTRCGDSQVSSQADHARHRKLRRAAIRPSLDATRGRMLFDSHLDHILRAALAAFFMLYSGIVGRPPLRAHLRRIWRAPRAPVVRSSDSGPLLGACGVSAVLHYVGVWELGRGTEFSPSDACFVLMGVGAVLECMKCTTGIRVRSF